MNWREVWHKGFVPHLSVAGLKALEAALEEDDVRLLQGTTVSPPLWDCVHDWPVEGACAISYCGWQGDSLDTVAEVERFFVKVCLEVDKTLGELACSNFTNWFDNIPRQKVRALLLPEVKLALALAEAKRKEKVP